MNCSVDFLTLKRMTPVFARAVACSVMLLVLPSCAIPKLRRAEPAPNLPESFIGVATPENSSLLGVDEFYHDPRLSFLIDQAVANNRELKLLEMEVQIASNEVLARSGAYLPFLSMGGVAGLNRESNRTIEGAAIRDDEYLPGKLFKNPHGSYQQGINFTWRVDIYRQLRNARDAAGQRYAAAIENRNFFVTRLVADVAENYYRLMALDKRIENLNQIIALQEQSLQIAKASLEFAEGTQLGVLRFEASIRNNQSEKLRISQDIVVTENRINFLLNRYPQAVDRDSSRFYDLQINTLNVGVPSQLLQNRPDIRQAERDLAAAGLDVKVARVNFYPQLVLNAGVGLEAYNMANLFNPQAVAGTVAGGLLGPLVNFRSLRADYLTANNNQMRAVYNYQRTILNAFTEVVNRLTSVRNYGNSVVIRKEQMRMLEEAVNVAEILFQNARTEYLDVLTAQQDLRDARLQLIDTKEQELTAIVNAYQALGGGNLLARPRGPGILGPIPLTHTVSAGENFWKIAEQYYKSGRYYRALWAANKGAVASPDRLTVGDRLIIPSVDDLDPALIEDADAPPPALPEALPAREPANSPLPLPPPNLSPPPPSDLPSPFAPDELNDPGVAANAGPNPPPDAPAPAAGTEEPGDQARPFSSLFRRVGSSIFRNTSQAASPVEAPPGPG